MLGLMSVLMPPPAFRVDTLRTLIVVGDEGETAVRLREALPREMVVVLDVRPDEISAAARCCRPYPWAVVWACAAAMPPSVAATRRPVILLVRTDDDLPRGALAWARVSELVSALQRMLGTSVGGMRLAPGMGVELPGGHVVRTASLQALVSMHPAGVTAPPAQFRAAASLLRGRHLGWTPAPQPDRTVVLVRQGEAR